jgi:tetratricopeptide (TPR) repeat protein
LATILRDEGKTAEAEAMFRQAMAIGQRAWGPDQTDEARIETNLGDLLAKRGKVEEGESLLRAALRSREKILPPNHPDIFDGKAKLGAVLVQERRYQEAEPLLLSAYHGLEGVPKAKSAAKRLALEKLVEMYTGWSRSPNDEKAKEAAKWKAIEEQGG